MPYTPYLAEASKTIMGGMESRRVKQMQAQQNQLAGSAYMGDPQAMQDLMSLNPELGIKIQQQVTQRQETTAQQGLQKRTQFKKEYDDLVSDIAKFPTFEEAKRYADDRLTDIKQRYPEIMGQIGVDEVFDEADYQEAKRLADEGEAAGAYIGKGMEAQVSNMLTQGVENPAFRNTPEYARAWQLANEPKIIRTPTGDIILRPELSPIFKPPGEVKTEKQQIETSKTGVKKDVEVIPGTEKVLKTTADEKVSLGYYNRMRAAEENIKSLGDFDSASIWERFKGITNITASPELQQYRQAADDWIRSKLRRESGAVIAEEEMTKEYEIYFPQIGDKQAVMDQKKQARKQAEQAMKVASGQEFKKQEAITEKPVIEQTTDLSQFTTEQLIEMRKQAQ